MVYKLENNISEIESQCGIKPIDVEIVEIGSDPNFIFVNDPNFNTLTLYDVEGNIINVNSWTECAHYVNGGWFNSQIINFSGDKYMSIALLVVSIVTSSLFFYIKRTKDASK